MSDVFYLDDTGDEITASVLIDLTGATSTDFYVKKPDGLEYTWAATVDVLNPGEISYTMLTGDLNQAGIYYYHARIVEASGDIRTFEVVAFLVASKYSIVCSADEPDFCSS